MKKLFQYCILFLILFSVFEGLFRIMGFKPYHFEPFSIVSEPAFCLIPDHRLGLTLSPGRFDVTMNEGLHYTATHSTDSLRITSLIPKDDSLFTIDFHGCSFTYGMGVDDDSAYPYRVQDSLSNYRIRTMAMPGHGILQALILLKEQELRNELPEMVVLNYAAFHDQRNILSLQYRKHLHYGFERSNPSVKSLFESARFPYATLDPSGEINIQFEPWNAIYQNWPGRGRLASVHFLQKLNDELQTQRSDGEAVSLGIIQEISTLCNRNQIRFLLSGITKDEATRAVLSKASKLKIETLMFEVDLSDEQFNNQPFDSHPNDRAHQLFAERFLNHFR